MLNLSDEAAKRLYGMELHQRHTVWVRFTYSHYVMSGYRDRAEWEFEVSSSAANWMLETAWKMYDKGSGVAEAISIMNAHIAVKRNANEAWKRADYPRIFVGA